MICQGAQQFLWRAEYALCPLDVESDNTLSRGFDTRGKRRSAINQRVLCCLFLFAVTSAEDNPWTLRRLGFGGAHFDPGKLRMFVTRENSRQRIRAIENGNWPVAPSQALRLGFAAQRCLHDKTRNEDAGKKHGLGPLPLRGENADGL